MSVTREWLHMRLHPPSCIYIERMCNRFGRICNQGCNHIRVTFTDEYNTLYERLMNICNQCNRSRKYKPRTCVRVRARGRARTSFSPEEVTYV